MDLSQLLGALGGTATGGGVTMLLAKWWFTKNEQKHDRHELNHKEVMAALTDIKTKMAALEVRAAEVVSIRDDVRKMHGELAVVKSEGERNRQDINVAHQRLRSRGKGDE